MTTKGFEVTKSETIMYEKGDGLAWITLNRPERLNALGRELGSARARALKDAADDDSVLVVIFTGAGGRSFSAGADLKEGAEQYYSGTRPDQQPPPEFRFDESECAKPTIAAIDGFALGGGLELSLSLRHPHRHREPQAWACRKSGGAAPPGPACSCSAG